MERRGAPRTCVNEHVTVAVRTEQPLPRAQSIDASRSGVLVALAEPFGLARDTTVCFSMPTDEGLVHLLGRVRRVERGDDFRTYVALSLDEPGNEYARERWCAWVEQLGRDAVAGVA